MNCDEQAIIALITQRIAAGRGVYGGWNVADGRDYERECLEEMLDGMAYIAARLVRLMRERDAKRGGENG